MHDEREKMIQKHHKSKERPQVDLETFWLHIG